MEERFLQKIIQATHLPQELVYAEIKKMISQANLTEAELTLEDFRKILAEYLQEVILEAAR